MAHRRRAAANRLQGLDPALKTVLVFYGGLGTPRMLKIAQCTVACDVCDVTRDVWCMGCNDATVHALCQP
jgi:hypothetical protein